MEQTLLSSISENDAHFINTLQTIGFDANYETTDGDTILTKAALHSSINVIDTLLQHGANVNLIDRNGNTTLSRIAQEHTNYMYMVQYLFTQGADIYQTNSDDFTPAEVCCQQGNHNTLEGFLNIGYPLNKRDEDGRTLLMIACYHEEISCVKILLKHGVDTNLQSFNILETASMNIVRYTTYNSISMLKLLLEHGANINLPDYFQETTFFTAVDYNLPDIIDLLLNYNANIDANNIDNVTPYLLAIANGNIKICGKFVKLKCLRSGQHPQNPVAKIGTRVLQHLEDSEDEIKWTEINKFFFGSGEQWPFTLSVMNNIHPIAYKATTSTFTSLQELLRYSIRNYLEQLSQVNLISQIEQLPLPNRLKDYLYFV